MNEKSFRLNQGRADSSTGRPVFFTSDIVVICRLVVIVIAVAVSGCAALGARRIPGDRFNYATAIGQSEKDQMLVNLVRLAFADVPVFVDVNSAVTSYQYSGGLGVSGTKNVPPVPDFPDFFAGELTLNYQETPTMTYTPVTGADFAKRMLQPVPIDFIFSLAQSGWPIDLLLLIGLQRINDVENMSVVVDGYQLYDLIQQKARNDIDVYVKFKEVVDLIVELVRRRLIEFTREENQIYLLIDPHVPSDAIDLIDEFRRRLNLDSKTSDFKVTTRTTKREDDEITIQTRSLLAIMNFLSKGIDIPHTLGEKGAIVLSSATLDLSGGRLPVMPLRIWSQPIEEGRPKNVFAAVRHEEHWFYIANSDVESKQVFSLLRYLFQLQAPAAEKVAPLLTLPVAP